ncbi:hypothetical protein DFH08DRAFT_1079212 [Mycena albidolilacea]|uniref:Uncharacterized protein n=1 Tax=Mycena albidolilacea TaxID=1033008 RepID=A0AAD7A6L7_9AGAR|nr:hypothetical protein DFH08DRAFT_1079212 [Mycena albidolilacea]
MSSSIEPFPANESSFFEDKLDQRPPPPFGPSPPPIPVSEVPHAIPRLRSAVACRALGPLAHFPSARTTSPRIRSASTSPCLPYVPPTAPADFPNPHAPSPLPLRTRHGRTAAPPPPRAPRVVRALRAARPVLSRIHLAPAPSPRTRSAPRPHCCRVLPCAATSVPSRRAAASSPRAHPASRPPPVCCHARPVLPPPAHAASPRLRLDTPVPQRCDYIGATRVRLPLVPITLSFHLPILQPLRLPLPRLHLACASTAQALTPPLLYLPWCLPPLHSPFCMLFPHPPSIPHISLL